MRDSWKLWISPRPVIRLKIRVSLGQRSYYDRDWCWKVNASDESSSLILLIHILNDEPKGTSSRDSWWFYHYSDVVRSCYARILSESWIWSTGCSRTGIYYGGTNWVFFLAGWWTCNGFQLLIRSNVFLLLFAFVIGKLKPAGQLQLRYCNDVSPGFKELKGQLKKPHHSWNLNIYLGVISTWVSQLLECFKLEDYKWSLDKH